MLPLPPSWMDSHVLRWSNCPQCINRKMRLGGAVSTQGQASCQMGWFLPRWAEAGRGLGQQAWESGFLTNCVTYRGSNQEVPVAHRWYPTLVLRMQASQGRALQLGLER